MTVVGLIFNTRAVSRMPLPLSAMSMICSLIFRRTTFVTEIELKRIARTGRVLTLVALLASLGCTAFDDVIALAVRTAHGDEHHVDLLYEKTSGWHTRGESANLKHYPLSIESSPSLLPRHDDLRGASNLSKAHLGEHGHSIRVIDIAPDMVPHNDVVILHKQGN